jgi:hypothetical protein
MSDVNQIKDTIKGELEKAKPSPYIILSSLSSLQILTEGIEFDPKDEWRYLPDIEFFEIVGEIFNLNPEFFMEHIYREVRKKVAKDMKKRRKSQGISFMDSVRDFKEQGYVGNLINMDKYIFEKFCLNDGEQILLESGGIIQFGGVIAFGTFYITNNRIISQCPLEGISSSVRRKSKSIINISKQQKCYGYMFPFSNISRLKKLSNRVSYKSEVNGRAMRFKITIAKLPNREEHKNKIFEILSKHSKDEIKYH